MSRIKRVGLSLGSALASELLVAGALTAADHSGASGLLAGIIGFSIFVLPGWLLSLPMVLLFDRADGWRFWDLGIYGTLLGPAIILVLAVVDKITGGNEITYYSRWAEIAFVIALLSTATYLSVVKWSLRDSIEQTNHDC